MGKRSSTELAFTSHGPCSDHTGAFRKQVPLHVPRFMGAALVSLVLLIGCADPSPVPHRDGNVPRRYADEARRIDADPVNYLRELAERCRTLEQYRLIFHRQERLGGVLQPMERIVALYRREPHSVSFQWEDPQAPYCQAVYVQGRDNDKLLIRERKGILFMPPQDRMLDVEDVVELGRSRQPITAFGLEQLIDRTLAPFDDPELAPVMTITYKGVVHLEPTGRPAHHLHITRPPLPGVQYTQQDFYVDVDTGWPAGTDLWLENGQLDARYLYSDIDTEVSLADWDFELGPCPP